MKFAFIQAERANFPVAFMCKQLEVSRSGYYAWVDRPAPAKTSTDAELAAEIEAAHERSRGTYGSPRVHAELKAAGRRVGRKRVERLMRENGLQARRKRRYRRTTNSNHGNPVAPNVVARQFEPTAANQVWATDVTYVWTLEGWLYLAVMLDLFSRRVVGWAVSDVNDTTLALDALSAALRTRRPRPGLVHHSDRGSPYASDDYRATLKAHGLVASMSRTGDCWDNAVAESFFATIKAELVDAALFESRTAACAAIEDYIEQFYNPQRRHSFLGYMTPVEYELKAQVVRLAA